MKTPKIISYPYPYTHKIFEIDFSFHGSNSKLGKIKYICFTLQTQTDPIPKTLNSEPNLQSSKHFHIYKKENIYTQIQ